MLHGPVLLQSPAFAACHWLQATAPQEDHSAYFAMLAEGGALAAQPPPHAAQPPIHAAQLPPLWAGAFGGEGSAVLRGSLPQLGGGGSLLMGGSLLLGDLAWGGISGQHSGSSALSLPTFASDTPGAVAGPAGMAGAELKRSQSELGGVSGTASGSNQRGSSPGQLQLQQQSGSGGQQAVHQELQPVLSKPGDSILLLATGSLAEFTLKRSHSEIEGFPDLTSFSNKKQLL